MTRLRSSCLPVCVIAIVSLTATIGCFEQRDTVHTEYGKIRGESGGTSVNGVSVLADMLRERGHAVTRYGRLSPKIERYETLVWFPANKDCPSDEAVDRLEQWLDNGYRRTLIYVGYDFAGEVDYYRQLVDVTEGEQQERALRALAEAQLREDARLYDDVSDDWRVMFVGGKPSDDRCRWFNLEIDQRETSNRLAGPLTETLPSKSRPVMQTRAWLKYRQTYLDSHPGRKLENLLTVDQRPFAFRYYEESGDADNFWVSGNQLIFVNNARFLANYGLIEASNRQLAENLIEYVEPHSDVLFLESDENGIEVSDSDYDAHNSWSWITQKPLCYMVPHFLIWGVLFCFAFYPIFGRPRRTTNDRNRSFGDHIAAIGRLSGRHLSTRAARAKVHDYLKANEAVPKKQHKVSKSSGENVSQ